MNLNSGLYQLNHYSNNDLGDLSSLKTSAKDSIVNAINEVFRYGGNIVKSQLVTALRYSGLGITDSNTFEEICAALAKKFPGSVTVYPNGNIHWSGDISNISLSINNYGPNDPYSRTNTINRYSSAIDVTEAKTLRVYYILSGSGNGTSTANIRGGGSSNGTNLFNNSLNMNSDKIDINVSHISGNLYLSFYIANTCAGYDVERSTNFRVTSITLLY